MTDAARQTEMVDWVRAVMAERQYLNECGDLKREIIDLDRLACTFSYDRLDELNVSRLVALGRGIHEVDIEARSNGLVVHLIFRGASSPRIELSGDPQDALTTNEAEELDRAVESGDASRALTNLQSIPAEVKIVFKNDANRTGTHWIATTRAFHNLLTGPLWLKTVREMGGGPRNVLIHDAGSAVLRSQYLLLRGPEHLEMPQLPDVPTSPRHHDGRLELPPPTLFSGLRSDTDLTSELDSVNDLVNAFDDVSRRLAWFHLASQASVTHDGFLDLTLNGARDINFILKHNDLPGDPGPDVQLYEWATSSSDPAVMESTIRAASLAIVDREDVLSAATPALRTARSLYELTRRGAIAEALSARRSARDAASSGARSATDSARTIASKAVERATVQVGAAIAIALSRAANLIDSKTALVLLVVVGVLLLLSLVVARFSDLRTAGKSLNAELDDLDQYREALSTLDIEAIRKSKSVIQARSQLDQAGVTVVAIHCTAIAIGVIASIVILSSSNSTAELKPTTDSPTVSTSITSEEPALTTNSP